MKSILGPLPWFNKGRGSRFIQLWLNLGPLLLFSQGRGTRGEWDLHATIDFSCVNIYNKIKLLQSYCCDFYGSQLWDLSNHHIYNLCVAWRKALKRAMSVPFRTHTRFLSSLSRCPPLIVQLEKRFCKFYFNCINNRNIIVKNIIQKCTYSPYSYVGSNIRYIVHKYNIYRTHLCSDMSMIPKELTVLSETDECHLNVITELLEPSQATFLSDTERKCLINDLCTC